MNNLQTIKELLNIPLAAGATEVIMAIKELISENKKFRKRAIAADERADKLESELQNSAKLLSQLNDLIERKL